LLYSSSPVASSIASLGLAQQLSPRIERQNAAPVRAPQRAGAPEFSLVNAVRTQLTPGEAKNALEAAWRDTFGETPSAETSAILTAQWAHETGRGGSMFNFNFGGIKGAGPSGHSVLQRTKEGYGDTERTIRDRFRAYGSAEEGARDYVKLLNARFPKALEAAREGDAEGFVRALKQRGYFTGDESAYVRSVTHLSREMLGTELRPVRQIDQSTLLAKADFPAPRAAGPNVVDPAAFAAAAGSPEFAPFVDSMSIADALARSALSITPFSDDRRDRDV
jgi:hypothetical protein